MRKVIITAAFTGSLPPRAENENKPMTPDEIAEEVVKCAEAGAAVCHIHARDAQGLPTKDIGIWREIDRKCRERMRAAGVDAILSYTTSVGTDEDRFAHCLELKPEMAAFEAGSLNWIDDGLFINSPAFLKKMGKALTDAGIKPELGIFDAEMIKWCIRWEREGYLKAPLHFQLMMGTYGGADATVENLLFMKKLLPAGSTCSVTGIGRNSLPMIMTALAMGADGIRVGLEDNLFMDKGVQADNVMQVRRAAELIRLMNDEVATAAEAREILGLPARRGEEAGR